MTIASLAIFYLAAVTWTIIGAAVLIDEEPAHDCNAITAVIAIMCWPWILVRRRWLK